MCLTAIKRRAHKGQLNSCNSADSYLHYLHVDMQQEFNSRRRVSYCIAVAPKKNRLDIIIYLHMSWVRIRYVEKYV